MDKELMIRFLIKEAIKPSANSKHQDRLWDAIRKANRDVMTGARTGNIPQYVKNNKDNIDKSLECLYIVIKNEKEPLCSAKLIKELQEENITIEFGAIQKLVNMTLKYLIILNECENSKPIFNICEEKCDCPIDSAILDKLFKISKVNHECWTKMQEDEYTSVQSEIALYLKKEYPQKAYGNIWFDFLMWKTD